MGKALTWIGGVLLAVLTVLLVVPHLVDWNRYRGTFEEEASRALGREVRVGGGVNLRLLPSPYVRFEKLRMSDTAGTLGEPFFRAESFTMHLAITPLLRGGLEATEVELRQPVLTLAIDGDGRGNWRDVALAPAAAFLPAEVKLKSVAIKDGQLSVKGNDGPLVQLSAINGELSADALAGPYKFRGSVAKDGAAREVRLSTAAPDQDGALRFKAIVRTPETDATYSLDGRIVDLGGKPKLDGELTARAPLPGASADATKKPSERDTIELRSRVEGDAFGVSLPDIALTFELGAQPQLVNGDAALSWRDTPRIKLALASKWLDVDRIAASRPETGPIETVRSLLPGLVGLLPEKGQVDARLTVDQITLGGEVASNTRLHLERFRGPMLVRELQMALPGGTRLDLTGTLAVQGTEQTFTGDMSLKGNSHARFLGWAAKGQSLIDSRTDGPFSLGGRLSVSPAGLELSSLSADMNGAPPLTGALAYASGERKRIDLRIEGQQIDVSSVLPGGLDASRVSSLLWPAASPASPATTGTQEKPAKSGLPALLDPRTTDSRVVVRATEIGDGETVYRDVDVAFSLDRGKLEITQARLTTVEGVRLELEGGLTGIGETVAKGTVRGTVATDTAEGAGSILAALNLSVGSPGKARDALLSRLAPARLAGALHLGDRGPTSTGIAIDGAVRGARTIARIDLDDGPSRWRDGAVSARIRIDGAEAALSLAELLVSDGQPGVQPSSAPSGGLFHLDVTGHPRKGLLTLASLKADTMALAFDGRVVLPGDAAKDVDGIVRVEAGRAEPVLGLMGLAVPGLRDVALKGAVELSSKGDALRIKSRGLAVGGTEVAGLLTLNRPSGAPVGIDAALFVAKASLSGLLTPLLGPRGTPARETQPAAAQIWPDRPFDTAAFDALRGRIKLAMGALSVAPGLTVTDASLDAELTPGQIKLTNLDGRALGGELKARLVLEKAPMAGAALAGALRIDDARLEAIAGKSAATGAASLLAQFSGRALTPLALVQALQGKGEVTLASGQILRHSPSTVPHAIDTVLDGKGEAGGEALRKLLREGLASSPVKLPATKLALQIADGNVKVQKLELGTEDARASVETAVELATLKFDSEWRLQPKGPPKRVMTSQAGKSPLPGISLIYVGSLGDIAAVEPRMDTEALERVLVVLRMERDVEELERLRREDEERIRREIERQKALEEERKKALEESRTVPPAPAAAASGSASPAQTAVPQPMGPLPPAPGQAPPRFEVRPTQQLGPNAPLVQSPTATGTAIGAAPSSASAQAAIPGSPPTATDAAQPAPSPADGSKRPARLGPPRPTPAAQPKFNPFGAPGLGVN